MTTFMSEVLSCAVCRKVSAFRVLASTSAFGSSDLDLRPPPPTRYTLEFWQQECPGCGFVNVSIDTPIDGAAAIVGSPEFTALRAAVDEPVLVNRFKRFALLIAEDPVKAGWTMLHAAWVCDDLELRELAVRCREECADLWSGLDFRADEDSARMRTVMVDVLRRAERFDEADALIDVTLGAGGATATMVQALDFQRQLIAAYDIGVYTVEQALAAAPRPHG